VRNALDPDLRDGRAGERGENDAAKAVAERMAVSRIQGIDLVDALVAFFRNDAGL
jgi:hypothetical protein